MMENRFCAEGVIEPKCYKIQDEFEFESEESLYDVLLDMLKSELPARLQKIKDCNNNPMFIDEKDIDLYPPSHWNRLHLLLNPVGELVVYEEYPVLRTVDYRFEIYLTVSNKEMHCVTWELLRFKNAVENLLINVDLRIPNLYQSANIIPTGYVQQPPTQADNEYSRVGIYRFTVTVIQSRK